MKTKTFFLLFIIFTLSSDLMAQESRIVVMNHYWAKEGKIEEVYQHRLYASEVRKKLGLAVGRVLLNTETKGESPDVTWECEYQTKEARDKDVQLLQESGQFVEVMKKMDTLTDKFQRTVYIISTSNK